VRAWTLAGSFFLLLGCGDDDTTVPPIPDAGPPPPPPATFSQVVAFEGHELVNAVRVTSGADLSDATLRPEPGAPIEVLEQECNAEVCGAVLRIMDDTPNRGIGVPAPIDAVNTFVLVETPTQTFRALLTVEPIDAITARGTDPMSITRPTILASSADTTAGSIFTSGTEEPIRIVVFGNARLAGDFDLSPQDGAPVASGFAGGAADAAGEGPGGGEAGGGGGGHGTAGEDGASGAGGDETGDPVLSCVDAFDGEGCGGSGGGGAAGRGGAGGGALLFVTLGFLDASGGSIRSNGGDGTDGAGGGAGGSILLASPELTPPASVEANGGAGDGEGGAGGEGRLRVDATNAPDGVYAGPAVDLSAVERITNATSVTFSGRAIPGSTVTVAEMGGATRASADADSEGAFSVDVPLDAGLNRLTVTGTDPGGEIARSWVGNGIEFGSVGESRLALPIGATIDIVSIP